MAEISQAEQEGSKKSYSSNFVFFWIGLSLVSMAGFMFICKSMGVLNPRQNWEMEFTELASAVSSFHLQAELRIKKATIREQQDQKQMQDDPLEDNIDSKKILSIFKKYAGNQIELRQDPGLRPVYHEKQFLNRKQLSIVFLKRQIALDARRMLSSAASAKKVKTIADNSKIHTVNSRLSDSLESLADYPVGMTVAIFPIAQRQLKKTFKFARGSFLWHAYTISAKSIDISPKNTISMMIPGMEQGERGVDTAPKVIKLPEFVVVDSDDKSPEPGQINLVAANYMNDYFIIAVARGSHIRLVDGLVASLSLYHSDFIRTL